MTNLTPEQQLKLLHAPFDPCELEWRFQKSGKQGDAGVMLPYVSARAIMDRLDTVVGPQNWSDLLRCIGDHTERRTWACALELQLSDGSRVAHEDVADETHVEPAKGGASDALKRVAVKFGIGRYLYYLPKFYVDGQPRPAWKWAEHIANHLPKKCPWAVPGGSGRPPEGKGSSGWSFDTSFSTGTGGAPTDEPAPPPAQPAPQQRQPAQQAPAAKPQPERKPEAPARSGGQRGPGDDPDVPLPTHSAPPFNLKTTVKYGQYKDMQWGWVALGSPDGRRRGWLRWAHEKRDTFDRQSMTEQAYMASQLLGWLEGKPTPAEDPWDQRNDSDEEAPF